MSYKEDFVCPPRATKKSVAFYKGEAGGPSMAAFVASLFHSFSSWVRADGGEEDEDTEEEEGLFDDEDEAEDRRGAQSAEEYETP